MKRVITRVNTLFRAAGVGLILVKPLGKVTGCSLGERRSFRLFSAATFRECRPGEPLDQRSSTTTGPPRKLYRANDTDGEEVLAAHEDEI